MKQNGKEYVGVEDYTPRELKEYERLVAVWFDGEPDLYICQGEDGIRNLEQMYRDDWDSPADCPEPRSTYEGHVSRVQVFKFDKDERSPR